MSTALSAQPFGEDLLNFEDAAFSLDLNEELLAVSSLLGLLGAFGPSLADVVAEYASDLDALAGEIEINQGVFKTELFLPDGSTVVGKFDAPTTLRNLAALATATDAEATLKGGVLGATVTTDEAALVVDGFGLAAFVEAYLLTAINSISATIPFVGGQFFVETDSILGPINATIDVADGDLNVAVVSSLGTFSADVDFGADAVLPFVVPSAFGDIDVLIDFDAGNAIADVGFLGTFARPISSFDGDLTLADGIATLTTEVPFFGQASADFEIGPMASELVAAAIEDITATATVIDGELNAELMSDDSVFEVNFNIADFTEQGARFFEQLNGTVDISGGMLAANLATALGEIAESFELQATAGLFDVPFSDISL